MAHTRDVWLHGNSIVMRFPGGAGLSPHFGIAQKDVVDGVPWTDIVGLRTLEGVTFRGKQNNFGYFTAPFQLSVLEDGKRARLDRISFQFESDPGVTVAAVQVFNGIERIEWFQPESQGERIKLTENVNRFNCSGREIYAGVALLFEVIFNSDGDIRFQGAGLHLRYE